MIYQVDGGCGAEAKYKCQGVERGRRQGWKGGEGCLRSEFIQVLENVTNVNISQIPRTGIVIINPWTKSEWRSELFRYEPPHVSRGLLTLSSLPFRPSFNASLVVVNSYALRLILGAFVVFHYKNVKKQKNKKKTQNSSRFFFCVSLSVSHFPLSRSVG